jgi:hypothetical protein
VEEVFQRWGVIWEVAVGEQVLRTTAEHPFWVRGRGWTAASELRVGDELRSHDGQWLAVEDVRDTGREEAVYNGRVAEWHTYFVGCAAWGFSLWAHNSYAPVGRGPNGRPTFADDWETLLSQRYGAVNVQRVPQFRTVQDVLQNPAVLTGMTPAEVAARIGSTPG